jgi:hypothetical protein
MPKLTVGDIINCRVKSAQIVSPYRDYDEIKSFVIVAADDNGYYIFVPHYYLIKGTFVLDQYASRVLDINPKYIGDDIILILENMVAFVESKLDGIACKICKEFFSYAASNQPDGTMICFSCRENPYR